MAESEQKISFMTVMRIITRFLFPIKKQCFNEIFKNNIFLLISIGLHQPLDGVTNPKYKL